MRRSRFERVMTTLGHWRKQVVAAATACAPVSGGGEARRSVSPVEHGPPSVQQGQRIMREGKLHALAALARARQALADPALEELALAIYRVFFGDTHGPEVLPRWQRQLTCTHAALTRFCPVNNTEYVHLGLTSTRVMAVSVQAYQHSDPCFLQVNLDRLAQVATTPMLGIDHVATMLIHEYTHALDRTLDHAYVAVAAQAGVHVLDGVRALLCPQPLPVTRFCPQETDRARRARGQAQALNNADSVAMAYRYLDYSVQSPAFGAQFTGKLPPPGAPMHIILPCALSSD